MRDVHAIVASIPLNQTAARVVARGGVQPLEPKKDSVTRLHWENFPTGRTRPIPNGVNSPVGRRFGRLVVCGLLADSNPKKNAAWIVRCDCGRFETRKAKALFNPKNTGDCCYVCVYEKRLRSDRRRRIRESPGAGRRWTTPTPEAT